MVSEKEFPVYPSIRRIGKPESEEVLDGEEIRIIEKMDGSNFRFTYQDGGLIFGSRDTVLNPNNPVKPGDDYSVGTHFEDGVSFVLSNIEWSEVDWEELENYVFFGECMVSQTVTSHTIEYDWDNTPDFLGFDIYNLEQECYIHPSEMESIFSKHLNLPTSPCLDEFTPEEFNPSEYEIPQSEFRYGDPEGIIMMNPDAYPSSRPVKAKRWTEEFAETHKAASSQRAADTDTEEFIAKYITEQRIKKKVHKMVSTGEWETVSKSMMEELPTKVIEDAWEEEYREVLQSDLEINMGELRHKTCRKCVSVLEEMAED